MIIRKATAADFPAILALRFEVFVDEQHVPPEEERDEHDATAHHYLAEEADGSVIGCARVIAHDDEAHIGRLAVKKAFRGRGIGAGICRRIMEDCCARGSRLIWLNAQLYAVGFYEKLGFRAVGGIFLDAGIEHRRMEWTTDSPAND